MAMKSLLHALTLVFFLLFTSPAPGAAQEILAVVLPADLPRYHQVNDAMTAILRSGGFSEEKLKVFVQKPNPDKMSLANSLRRSQAAGASLVVSYGSYATKAAANELNKIPLLFADVYDPVAIGVVKTLAAPGVEATGATSKTDLAFLVGNLAKFKSLQKVGVLYTKDAPGSELQLAELQALAGQQGFSVVAKNVRNPKEGTSLAADLAGSVDALYLTESLNVGMRAEEIVKTVQAKNTPVFSQIPGLVTTGALLGLEADPAEQGKLVAVHALQVLQGQKAHILPVRQARNITLKVNASTATALGLSLPAELSTSVEIIP